MDDSDRVLAVRSLLTKSGQYLDGLETLLDELDACDEQEKNTGKASYRQFELSDMIGTYREELRCLLDIKKAIG